MIRLGIGLRGRVNNNTMQLFQLIFVYLKVPRQINKEFLVYFFNKFYSLMYVSFVFIARLDGHTLLLAILIFF